MPLTLLYFDADGSLCLFLSLFLIDAFYMFMFFATLVIAATCFILLSLLLLWFRYWLYFTSHYFHLMFIFVDSFIISFFRFHFLHWLLILVCHDSWYCFAATRHYFRLAIVGEFAIMLATLILMILILFAIDDCYHTMMFLLIATDCCHYFILMRAFARSCFRDASAPLSYDYICLRFSFSFHIDTPYYARLRCRLWVARAITPSAIFFFCLRVAILTHTFLSLCYAIALLILLYYFAAADITIFTLYLLPICHSIAHASSPYAAYAAFFRAALFFRAICLLFHIHAMLMLLLPPYAFLCLRFSSMPFRVYDFPLQPRGAIAW